MSTLHLGVRDVAYTDTDHPDATTTYQVAKILEENYGVMQVFWEAHKREIVQEVARNYLTAVDDLVSGTPTGREWPLPKTESAFRDYLDSDEWRKETGVMIMAAVMGKSSRKKGKKYASARPAFVDSGLYKRSFQAWMTR